jgi:hypothetical protein
MTSSSSHSPSWIVSSALLAGLLFAAPSSATAGSAEVERQLRDTQDRMQQLDDKIQAASDQLDSANQRVDEQSRLIERAGIAETRGASSGLPGFLGQISIGGSVQASYFWNANGPTAGRNDGMNDTNTGYNGAFYPNHPDANSFAFQAAWIDVEREIDEENRAGFRLDVAYGKTAELLGGIGNREIRDDSGFYIFDAYVQYLAPIGDGLTLKAGRFGTTIGGEYANDALNWNITQGSVYNLLEPLDHIGVIAEYSFGDSGFDAKLGAVNGFFANDPDNNESKSILTHFGWENDLMSIGLNGIWGNEQTASSDNASGVANLLFTIDPTDRLSFWVNADFNWIDAPGGPPSALGVAAAGRFAFTDRTSLALRAEYVDDNDNYLGFLGFNPNGDIPGPNGLLMQLTDVRIWGVTATLDHLLTDHLKLRGEVRYDAIHKDDASNGEFFDGSTSFSSDQLVIGAEVIYNFNKWGGDD